MPYASKSPWVIHYDGSSCNGCDIEVLATLCPGFDGERFGVVNTGNPKHADILLVTGSVNERNVSVVREIYDQMLEPKVVVACGICACSGGIFHDCYNVIGGVDKAIPVDVYAPGCAVRPEALLDAIIEGVGVLDERAKALKESKKKRRETGEAVPEAEGAPKAESTDAAAPESNGTAAQTVDGVGTTDPAATAHEEGASAVSAAEDATSAPEGNHDHAEEGD